MKISIALASYNGAPFIRDQLESFAAQTRKPDEVVICDDCSSDSTFELAGEFAAHAPFPVHVARNGQRLGMSQNFGQALSRCAGDLVFLSDQDDVWFPGKLETMSKLAEAHPEYSCLMHDSLLTDRALTPTGTSKRGQIRAAGLPDEAFVMGCCAVFRASLLRCLLPIPPDERTHDNWLVQMADLMGQVLRTNVPLQYYRRHETNFSDFFVNSVSPRASNNPGRLRWLLELPRRMTRPGGLDAELRFLTNARFRLESESECVALLGSQRHADVLEAVGIRLTTLTERVRIRSLPRQQRIGPVLALWRRHGYDGKKGLVSMLKDLSITVHARSGTSS